MIRKRNNKKGICLLLFLTAFSFSAVKIYKEVNADFRSKSKVGSVAKASQSCNSGHFGIAMHSSNSEKNYRIVELPESETVKVSQEDKVVKGSSAISCTAGYANMLRLNEAEVCLEGSGDLNYDDGNKIGGEVKVSKNAQFELVEVWYPLAFWLGQFEYIDSNKGITNASTEYRGSGEQINENYQARNLAPKEANMFRQEVSDTVRQNFALEGTVDANPEENKEQKPGEYVVRNVNDAVCACSPKVAVSDYNVGKSNYIASDPTHGGYRRVQAPKGDNYDSSGSSCLEEGAKYEEIKDGVVNACTNVLALVKGFFHEIFSPSKWEGCIGNGCTSWGENGKCVEYGKTDECISAEGITVKMPSIFGDPYKCTTELCANAFLTYVQKASLAPATASSKKVASTNIDESLMFFVATKCKVQVVGTNTVITVKCLWDASPLLSNYNLQKKDHAPREDSKPVLKTDYPKSFDEYWKNTNKMITESAKFYKLPTYID